MYDQQHKIIILLLLLALIFSLFTIYISSEEQINISARSAALYEPETERFLYTKNPDQRLGMASTTKIMTALIALEVLDPEEKIAVDDRAIGIEGSSIYLKPGETMNALDLIFSLLLQSANDAAAALAYRISGSIDKFAALMNQRAADLGLKDTNFTNPHGLDDEDHYTTAHDLAVITAEALKNDMFREIASTYKMRTESSTTSRLLVNHNKMLKSYDGCIGVKTGYTKKCGRCLVSAAERDDLTLISVTIDAPSDWSDHTKLLDYGYSRLEAKYLCRTNEFSFEIPILNGEMPTVSVSNTDEVKMIFDKGKSDFESHVKLSRYFAAPIERGDVLGVVIFTVNGETVAYVPLKAEENVNTVKKRKFFSLSNI